jgi:hypothetical protein
MLLQGAWVDLQGQLQQSLSFFGLSVKVRIDLWINRLTDHLIRRIPITLAHILRALDLQSGQVRIRHVSRKLWSSPDLQLTGARIISR